VGIFFAGTIAVARTPVTLPACEERGVPSALVLLCTLSPHGADAVHALAEGSSILCPAARSYAAYPLAWRGD